MDEFISTYLPLLFLLALIVIGFGFPSWVAKNYQEIYGYTPLLRSYAAIQGFCLVWLVFEYDHGYSTWLLFAFLSVLVSYGLGMWRCASLARQQGASSSDVKIAGAAQAVFSIGIAVVIFIIIMESMYESQKKKRRR